MQLKPKWQKLHLHAHLVPKIGSKIIGVLPGLSRIRKTNSKENPEILEVNYHLEDTPEIINSSPYGKGWFFKLKPVDITELDNLISPEEYSLNCEV